MELVLQLAEIANLEHIQMDPSLWLVAVYLASISSLAYLQVMEIHVILNLDLPLLGKSNDKYSIVNLQLTVLILFIVLLDMVCKVHPPLLAQSVQLEPLHQILEQFAQFVLLELPLSLVRIFVRLATLDRTP